MSADAFARRTASLLVLALAALAAGCTSSGQSGSAFVFLNVDLFSIAGDAPVGNVNSNLGQRQAATVVCVTLSNNPKNPTVTTPTGLDNVTITQYTVSIQRFDGGPAPGPFVFNTAFTVLAATVSAEGAVTAGTARIPVVLVPAQAKNEPPLFPRPGIPLSAVATVLFKGRDGRGQGVETQGSVGLTFIFDQETAETAPTC